MHNKNNNGSKVLNQLLLQIPRNLTGSKDENDNNSLSSSLFHFLIRNPCKDISHVGANAEEYYHVELVSDDLEYGIQAYGEEAKELYKEINGFTVSIDTSPTSSGSVYKELLENDNKYQEQERLKLVKEAINCITDCRFDNGRVLMFKKLRNVCVSKKKYYV
jgi:hypothetical protein